MPKYLYACEIDGEVEKKFKFGNAPKEIKCPKCKEMIGRKYSATPVHYSWKAEKADPRKL